MSVEVKASGSELACGELDTACPPSLFSDSLEEEKECATMQEELNDSLSCADEGEAQQDQTQLSVKKEDMLDKVMKSLNDSLSHEESGEDVCLNVDSCVANAGLKQGEPENSSSTVQDVDVVHSGLPSVLPQQKTSETYVSSEQAVQVQQSPKKKPVFGKKKKPVANAAQPHVLAPLNDNTLQAVGELPAVSTTNTDSDKAFDCENTAKECPHAGSEGVSKPAAKKPRFSVKPKPSTKEILAKFCADEANKSTKSSGESIQSSESVQSSASIQSSEVATKTQCETPTEIVKKPRKTLTPEEKEARKIELEQKKLEREMKKEEAEKKRIERENKKKEMEQKRIEREQKKIEREALKKQKQLEAEKRKAEKEQLKIERELKKMEQQQKKGKNDKPKNEKVIETSTCEDCVQEEDDTELKVDDDTSSEADETEDGMKSEEELIDVDGIDSADDVKSGDNDIELKHETADSDKITSSCTFQDQSAGNLPSSDQALKITNEDDVAPVKKPTKRFKPPTQAGPKPKKTKTTTARKKGGGGAPRKPSTAPKKQKRRAAFAESDSDNDFSPAVVVKRLRPAVLSGPVWVQCENIGCQKWRKLRDCYDPSELPEDWKCSMNTDPEHNSCSAPEEDWNNLDENQEYVESVFVPGSLVWAKLEGYPWWPAMIEEDPDVESYYQLGNVSCHIPVQYHVVFFDTPVSRGWINSHGIQLFSDMDDANAEFNIKVLQKHKRGLQSGIKQAKVALNKSLKERLLKYGFRVRFQHLQAINRKKKCFSDETVSPTVSIYSREASDSSFDDDSRLPKQLQLASDNDTVLSQDATQRLAVQKQKTETVVIQYEE